MSERPKVKIGILERKERNVILLERFYRRRSIIIMEPFMRLRLKALNNTNIIEQTCMSRKILLLLYI